MNKRKVNWLFLSVILLHIVVVVLIIVFADRITLGLVPNFLISELILVIPAAAFLLFSEKKPNEILRLKKIKVSTALMVIVFTFTAMPLTTVVNAVSMLFVDNVVVEMSTSMLTMPFIVMLFLIGIYAPVCEEIVFRGVIYQGYRRSGNILKAMLLSAFLFGLMHMNLNQAPYAFVLGIALVLLVEVTGSIWSSILFHFVFNSQSVCLMYLYNHFMPQVWEQQAKVGSSKEEMVILISVYLVFAAVATSISACILIWLAKNENRLEHIRSMWANRREKTESLVTAPLIIAIVIAVAFMLLEYLIPLILRVVESGI